MVCTALTCFLWCLLLQVDWYCCNVGSFHVTRAVDPSVALTEDENAKLWVLHNDRVLARTVARAVGAEELYLLSTYFREKASWLDATKVERAIITLGEGYGQVDGEHGSAAALALIATHSLATEEAQQIELDILLSRAFAAKGSEAERLRERIEELMNGNTALRVEDKLGLGVALHYSKVLACLGASIAAWDAGCTVTDETLLAGFRLWFNSFLPLSQQAYEESTGARREAQRIVYQLFVVLDMYPSVRTEQAAALVHEGLHKHAPADALFEACAAYDFKR